MDLLVRVNYREPRLLAKYSPRGRRPLGMYLAKSRGSRKLTDLFNG